MFDKTLNMIKPANIFYMKEFRKLNLESIGLSQFTFCCISSPVNLSVDAQYNNSILRINGYYLIKQK